MRYGKRIRNGGGTVEWCELEELEVILALKANVQLNSEIYEECLAMALAQRGLDTARSEDRATLSMNPRLASEVGGLARVLFEQCAVKGFVALQEALAEKVHEQKANGGD